MSYLLPTTSLHSNRISPPDQVCRSRKSGIPLKIGPQMNPSVTPRSSPPTPNITGARTRASPPATRPRTKPGTKKITVQLAVARPTPPEEKRLHFSGQCQQDTERQEQQREASEITREGICGFPATARRSSSAPERALQRGRRRLVCGGRRWCLGQTVQTAHGSLLLLPNANDWSSGEERNPYVGHVSLAFHA
jgi:hypothetical protein